MVKTYLRYVPSRVGGVIASTGAGIASTVNGRLLCTPALEGVAVWDVKRGVEMHTLTPTSASSGDYASKPEVTAIVTCHTGAPLVAVGYADGMIRLFDHQKMVMVMVLNGHKKAVTSLAFNASGLLLASGSRDTDVIVWDIVAEAGLCRFRGHKDEVTDVAFLLNSGAAAAAGTDAAAAAAAPAAAAAAVAAAAAGVGAELLVTCSKDTLAKVWNLSTKTCVQTIVGARAELWSLTVLPSADRVLMGAADNQLRVWAVGSKSHIQKGDAAVGAATDEPGAAALATDVLLPMGSITRQTGDRAATVRATQDGRYIGVQSAGKLIEVYARRDADEVRRRVLRRLRRHREKVMKREKAAAAAQAVTTAASTAEDAGDDMDTALLGTSVADIEALIAEYERQLTAASAPATSPAGSASSGADSSSSSMSATALADAQQRLVTAGDEFELVALVSATAKIVSFTFLPAEVSAAGGLALPLVLSLVNNQMEVHVAPTTAAAAKALKAETIMSTMGLPILQAVHTRTLGQQGHRTDVRALAISRDGAYSLSSSTGAAKVWNTKTGSCVRTLDLGDETGLCCAFGPGDRHALIGTKEGKLHLFDLASGDELEVHEAHTGAIWSCALRPDGRAFMTGSADKEVKFWDFELKTVAAGGAGMEDAKKTTGKKTAAAGAGDAAAAGGGIQQLTLCHARTLKIGDEVLCVRYSHHPDAAKRLVAVALLDSTVKVFFDDSLRFALSLYGHKLPVMSMDISADSSLLVTASADKNVKLWGLDFGDCHHSFFAHSDSIMSVAFLSNTHYFFTASKDRTIKYWDGDRFEHILTLEGHKAEVWAVATAADGSYIMSASADRSIRTWRRTDEQVFLEEERERESDARALDKELREADGDAVLGGSDSVGALGADGMAKSVSMDAPAAAVSLMGDAVQEATTVIAHATKDTLTATDRVLEALALAAEETEKWTEYAQDVATATAAGEDAAAVVEMPARNPLLLNLTPAAYVLRTLRAVRPSDLDQVLLVLPFADALHLLRYLHHCLTRGQGVELACHAALLLLRVHQAQIVSNQALRPLIAALCTAMHEAARAHVDRIGFNIAGLHYIESLLAHVAMPKLVEPPKKKKSEGFRAGKRRRVRIM